MANTARRSTSASARRSKTAQRALETNQLLAALPRLDREQMIAKCEQVNLTVGESLYECGEPIRFVYFPTGSFVSLLASTDRASRVEVALIGSEGMLGMSCILDVAAAPLKTLVQGSGSAWRMEVGEFRREIQARPALSNRLARYLYVRMLDLSQMVTCTRFHLLEPRLARWLLMLRDRAHTDHFYVTQLLMALMLGVRRAGVTKAAGSLQKRGLISYHRAKIVIHDRRGLERVACSCYARARDSYARHLG